MNKNKLEKMKMNEKRTYLKAQNGRRGRDGGGGGGGGGGKGDFYYNKEEEEKDT